MRRMLFIFAVVTIAISVISIPSAKALSPAPPEGIPEIISYQGIITDAAGVPLTGLHNITVSIYNLSSGGTALWSETHANVVLDAGRFTIMLGSVESFPGSLGFDAPYWLGVSVDGGLELSPRIQFASAATAFAARKVLERILPAGMVASFALATPPSGWLECNGQDVSRTTYADLFDAIGTMYGPGDGATTFNLPDYRGYFLRGWNNGTSNDPDATQRTDRGDGNSGDVVGSKQADELRTHAHDYSLAYSAQSEDGDKNKPKGYTALMPAPTSETGGAETRPKNISVLYCIKY